MIERAFKFPFGWPDLILVGEWMPITFFKNQHGKLVNETASSGIADKFGWWNCIAAADFDNDGKIDFIAGNLGENSFFSANEKYPLNNFYADFDNNGRSKTITTKFFKGKDGDYKEYVAVSRDETIDQFPSVKKKYLSYKSFAEAPFDKLFSPDVLKKSIQSNANYFASVFIKNMGNGKFKTTPLPQLAQLSSVRGIYIDDFDKDGNLDIFLCGNDYGMEVFNGRLDAMNGLVLKGDGKGGFKPLSIEQSGVYIPGDARGMVKIKRAIGGDLIVVSQNKSSIKVFAINR